MLLGGVLACGGVGVVLITYIVATSTTICLLLLRFAIIIERMGGLIDRSMMLLLFDHVPITIDIILSNYNRGKDQSSGVVLSCCLSSY
jgi:hypothetical protein